MKFRPKRHFGTVTRPDNKQGDIAINMVLGLGFLTFLGVIAFNAARKLEMQDA